MSGLGIAQIRKAITAAILAASAVIAAASQKGPLGEADWIAAAIAAVVAGVGVFMIPNAPATTPVATKPPVAPGP